MDRILTVEQMTFCEHEAEKYGVSLAQLMDNAAAQLAEVIASNSSASSKIVLLIGKGNNGGDGLVAANLLAEQGLKPAVVLCCGEPDTDLSSAAYARLDKSVEVLKAENALDFIKGADVLVDCIFGTGFHGSLRENILPVFRACKNCDGMKIACDLPSGVNARNGQADKLSFKADVTVTVLLIGKGNNGGDGLVAANLLAEQGLKPAVVLCCGEPDTDLSSAAYARLDKSVEVLKAENALDFIKGADVLVDCIFGTGFHGSLRENILPVFRACKNCDGMKIACDLPSGVNARNGQADKLSFKADVTVTFHRGKLGLYLQPAVDFCGEILVKDIGIDERCENTLYPVITPFDVTKARAALPFRPADGHKGTFGKVVSVAGSESYIGAAGLSAMAAMRTGVGLFELCTAKSVVNSLSAGMYECTYSAMKTDKDGFMVAENAEAILKKCEKASCLLIGCGLGHTAQTEKLVAELIENAEIPIVLDADGINSLCPNIDVLLKKKSTVILTPHPAELARLCGVTVGEVMSDRLGFAYRLSEKYGVTVLAKSADTFAVDGGKVYLCTEGTTALAKGGSGDMLAGIVSSYVAQGCDALDAAALGSFTLGSTALLAGYKRSERGIIARDVIDALPRFLYDLENAD